MMKTLIALIAVLTAWSAPAATIIYSAQHFMGNANNRPFTVSQATDPLALSTNIVFGTPQTIQPTNGQATFTLLMGNYWLSINGVSTPFFMPVPDSTNTYNAIDLVQNGLKHMVWNTNYVLAATNALFVLTNDPRAIFLSSLWANGANITNVHNSTGLTNVPFLNAFNVFVGNNEFASGVQFDAGLGIASGGYLLDGGKLQVGSTAAMNISNQLSVITPGGTNFHIGTNGVLYGNGAGLTNVPGAGGGIATNLPTFDANQFTSAGGGTNIKSGALVTNITSKGTLAAELVTSTNIVLSGIAYGSGSGLSNVPSISTFNANQFGTGGGTNIKSGALVTNLASKGTLAAEAITGTTLVLTGIASGDGSGLTNVLGTATFNANQFGSGGGTNIKSGALLTNVTAKGTLAAESITGTNLVVSGFVYGDGSGLSNVSIGLPTFNANQFSTGGGTNIKSGALITNISAKGILTAESITATNIATTTLTASNLATFGVLVANSGIYGDGAALSNITATTFSSSKALWVDPNGNDVTGRRGDRLKPFKTVYNCQDKTTHTYYGAVTNAVAGDTIVLMPGVHYAPGVPLNLSSQGVNLWVMPGATLIRTNAWNNQAGTVQTVLAGDMTAGPMIIPGNNSKITIDGTVIATNSTDDAAIGWKEGTVTWLSFAFYGYTNQYATNVSIGGNGTLIGRTDCIYLAQTNTSRASVTISDLKVQSPYACVALYGLDAVTKNLQCFSGTNGVDAFAECVEVQGFTDWKDYGSSFGSGNGTTWNYPIRSLDSTNTFFGTRLYVTTTNTLAGGIPVGSSDPFNFFTNSTIKGDWTYQDETGALVYPAMGTNTVWVDPGGNDRTGKRGVRSRPFKSLYGIHDKSAHTFYGAATVAQPGDTIIVNPGVTYSPACPLNLGTSGVHLWITPGATVIRTNAYYSLDGALQTVLTGTLNASPMIVPGNNSTIIVDGTLIATNASADAAIGWAEGNNTTNVLAFYGYTNLYATNVQISGGGKIIGYVDGLYFSQTNTAASSVSVSDLRIDGTDAYLTGFGKLTLRTKNLRGIAGTNGSSALAEGVIMTSGVNWTDFGSTFGSGSGTSVNVPCRVESATNTFYNTTLYVTTTNTLPGGLPANSSNPFYYATNATSKGWFIYINELGESTLTSTTNYIGTIVLTNCLTPDTLSSTGGVTSGMALTYDNGTNKWAAAASANAVTNGYTPALGLAGALTAPSITVTSSAAGALYLSNTTAVTVNQFGPLDSWFMTNTTTTKTISATNGAITVGGLTASRVVLTDSGKTLASAAASGAVPIDSDGSATTSAQVSALFPSSLLTNTSPTIYGFLDAQTNSFTTNTAFPLGFTNLILVTGANAGGGITGVVNAGTATERWGQLTIVASGTFVWTNPASIHASDFVTSRTITNGNTCLVSIDVYPNQCTNMAIVQFK